MTPEINIDISWMKPKTAKKVKAVLTILLYSLKLFAVMCLGFEATLFIKSLSDGFSALGFTTAVLYAIATGFVMELSIIIKYKAESD